jgi:hypothetical protein
MPTKNKENPFQKTTPAKANFSSKQNLFQTTKHIARLNKINPHHRRNQAV